MRSTRKSSVSLHTSETGISDIDAFAVEHGVTVWDVPLETTPSMVIQDRDTYHIAVNATGTERTAYIAHELGHALYAGLYEHLSPYDLVSRCEYRANKWAYKHLLPRDTLKELVRYGYRTTWEIAEEANLPEWFVEEAVEYYRNSGGLDL